MTIYMGLDVHSKQTSYCVQNETGKILAQGKVETSETEFARLVQEGLVLPEGTAVALETGTQAKWMSHLVSALGMHPVVVDACEVRNKSTRKGQKTDTRDAWEICDGLRRNQWTKIMWMPSPEIELLRQILSNRRHYVKKTTSEVNTAKFKMRQLGVRTTSTSLGTAAGWKKLMARPELSSIVTFLEMHFELWRLAQANVAKLEAMLAEAMEPFREQDIRMQTVYGVGPITSASFIAAVGDPHRFEDSNRVVSYLGCAPKTYDSGERKKGGGITKEGPSYVRAVLCEAAQQARRIDHPLNPYWVRLAAKSGKQCANMAVAARLARILWRMWRDQKPFDLGKLNVTYERVVRERLTLYSLKKQAKLTRTHAAK